MADAAESHWEWHQPAGRSATLHFLINVRQEDRDAWVEGMSTAPVISACGRRATRWFVPGIFSRLGAPRCKRCCAKLGIEPGVGTPLNGKFEREQMPDVPLDEGVPTREALGLEHEFYAKAENQRPQGPARRRGTR